MINRISPYLFGVVPCIDMSVRGGVRPQLLFRLAPRRTNAALEGEVDAVLRLVPTPMGGEVGRAGEHLIALGTAVLFVHDTWTAVLRQLERIVILYLKKASLIITFSLFHFPFCEIQGTRPKICHLPCTASRRNRQ